MELNLHWGGNAYSLALGLDKTPQLNSVTGTVAQKPPINAASAASFQLLSRAAVTAAAVASPACCSMKYDHTDATKLLLLPASAFSYPKPKP